MILLGVIILLTASVHRVGPSPQLQYQQIFPHGFISWPDANSPITPSFLVAFILLTFFGALGGPNYIRGFYSIRNRRAFRQGFTITVFIVVVLEICIVLLDCTGALFSRKLIPPIMWSTT